MLEAIQLIKTVKEARGINNHKDILFLSDNFGAYKSALIESFSLSFKKYKQRDSFRYFDYKIPKNINYAVVEKTRNSQGKIIMTKPKYVFGTKKKITAMLQSYFKDQKVNVSFIERLNLTNRQHNAKIERKTIAYAKDINSLKDQMILSRTYYNFCREHSSLKTPKRKDDRNRFRWQHRTPAMAENITDHVWSFEELLFFTPNVCHIMT